MEKQTIKMVDALKRGDSDAFEYIFQSFSPKVFALARTMLKDATQAEDIVQQVFIKMFERIGSLQESSAFSVWLYRMTQNLCYDLLRSKYQNAVANGEEILETLESDDDDCLPSVYAEREDLKERLGGIIDSLVIEQREAVVLYYFNDLSVEEIAQSAGVPVGTVKSRLYQARKRIQIMVEKEEKRSGERFYGVAGLPAISMGAALAESIASQGLDATAAATLQTVLLQSAQTAANASAQSAATGASQGTASLAGASQTAAGVTKATIPLIGKVVAGVAIAAVVATGGVVVFQNFAPEQDVSQPAIIEDLSDERKEPTESTEEMPPEEPESLTIEEAYAEILESYEDALESGFDTTGNPALDIPEKDHGHQLSSLNSYALLDVTGDGKSELVIGFANYDSDGNAFISSALKVFVYNEGKVVLLIDALAAEHPEPGVRTLSFYNGGLIERNSGYGNGGMLSATEYFQVSSDGMKLEFLEGTSSSNQYTEQEKIDRSEHYYHDAEWGTEITKSEYMNIYEKYRDISSWIEPDWHPISGWRENYPVDLTHEAEVQ
jgi:RNA polymerase sigma factor (sigma-70 family)